MLAAGTLALQGVPVHVRLSRPPLYRRVPASGTLGIVKSSVSIALFFLLSGFFLTILLGALERNRKLLAASGGFLVAVVVIIVVLTPVQLPSGRSGSANDKETSTSSTAADVGTTASPWSTTTTTGYPATTTTGGPHTPLYRTITTGTSGG